MNYKYKHAVLGGTFDRFHPGHQELIDAAFINSEKVTIGIATKDLYKNKYLANLIESHNTRLMSVKSYIEAKYDPNRAKFIEISDIYGNTMDKNSAEAIFVTEDTYANAELINSKRLELGLDSLKIVKVDFALSDDQVPITSERIRKGEIDRMGNSYLELFAHQKKYILKEEDREQFKKPIGKVIKNLKSIEKILKNKSMVVAIGDIVVLNLFEKGITADVSIIDYRTRRHIISSEQKEVLLKLQNSNNTLTANNFPGTIERRAVGLINKSLTNFFETGKKQVILIEGEEDLLTIPAILLSPLESIVLYGQPNVGVVVVTITERRKKEIKYLFSKLTRL